MTPEDWQRLWQGHEGGGPRNSPADLLVRSQQLVDSWKLVRFRLSYVIGVMWILMGAMRILEWTRQGAGAVLMLGIAHLAFGVGFIVEGWVGKRMTRSLPPAVTIVDFYRKLLEIERRRLRSSIPLMVVAGFQLFVFPLALARWIPSLRVRILVGIGSIVVYGAIAAFALRHLANRQREIRDLPDDT